MQFIYILNIISCQSRLNANGEPYSNLKHDTTVFHDMKHAYGAFLEEYAHKLEGEYEYQHASMSHDTAVDNQRGRVTLAEFKFKNTGSESQVWCYVQRIAIS